MCAHGWVGQAHTKKYDLSKPEYLKSLSSKNLLAFEFPNPTLHHRRIQESVTPPYAALRAARQNSSETDTSFIRVHLYYQIRTYFKNNH